MAFWIRTKWTKPNMAKHGQTNQLFKVHTWWKSDDVGCRSEQMLLLDMFRNVAQVCSKMYQDVVSKSRTPNGASTWRGREQDSAPLLEDPPWIEYLGTRNIKKHNTSNTGD